MRHCKTVRYFGILIAGLLLSGQSATAANQWTLSTDDTLVTIDVDAQGQPAIVKLENPATQFNWTQQPSSIEMIDSVVINGQSTATAWQYQGASVDQTNGTKLTLSYASPTTGLQMTSEWWARPGAGPIRQSSYITNAGGSAVDFSYQPTLSLQLTTPQADTMHAWHFMNDGGYGSVDPQGVYKEQIAGDFNRTLRTDPNAANGPIPLAVLDSGGNQGVYVGTEWSLGDIQIASNASQPNQATLKSGNVMDFQATLQPGQAFEVPPGFVGTYQGDIDAAGNSLRKYLYNYNMPDAVRDAAFPTVQWNAFGATGKTPGSWDPVESKFYPLVDDAAALGFEEVMIDVGWWVGNEPIADPEDWASGMKAAADYAHSKGMRFGLYWTDNADMATPEGRQTRADRIRRLFGEYDVDLWRSDNTHGALIASDYWSVKGFYDMVDALEQEIPNFQWENCSSGGRIKDYGAMKRSVKIFNSDNYSEIEVRKVYYDSSFAFHPLQLEGHLGTVEGTLEPLRPEGPDGMKYAFRSISMGAPEWFIDAPNGGNGGGAWTEAEREAVASCVATYKEMIRPLLHTADLYHIFPRPDGTAWDGIEYYDPESRKGAVFIFKPNSPNDTQTIFLKGLDIDRMYHLSFEDGTNPAMSLLGAELMNNGVDVTLYGTNVSELMFIEVPEPDSLTLLGTSGLILACMIGRRWHQANQVRNP